MARTQRLAYNTNRKSNSVLRQLFIFMLTVVIGVLVSVSVNAQQSSSNKEKESTKKKTKLPYKKKNRAKANFYALQPVEHIDPVIGESDISAITSLQLAVISEMVALNISESTNNAFEIAPLVFKVTANRLAAMDINPLLIAVQFARHGKNIEIANDQDQSDSFDLTRGQLEEIRTLMYKLGVPADSVKIKDEAATAAMTASGVSKIAFHVI